MLPSSPTSLTVPRMAQEFWFSVLRATRNRDNLHTYFQLMLPIHLLPS